MVDLYLRAETADALATACPFLRDEDGAWITAGESFAFDPIGAVLLTSGTYDEKGIEIDPSEIDERFHAILRCTAEIDELVPDAMKLDYSEAPRKWAGDASTVSAPTVDDINAERDRRTVAGFVFNGIRFQSRPQDRENIMGAFALASTALTVGGKQPGDLRWHGGDEDFVFIAEDDSRVPMDAVTVLGLGQAAAAQKSALTFAASNLKKLDPIPSDFADDRYWPAPA